MSSTDRPTQRCRRGFSLIELMIAVSILAIVMSIALPAFMDSMRKSRRSEGFAALAAVQQAQERWRANRTSYSSDLSSAWPTSSTATGGLGIGSTTANGRYTLALAPGVPDYSGGYEIKATAAGSQTADSRCYYLAVRMQAGTITYGSGSSAVDWTDGNGCWAK